MPPTASVMAFGATDWGIAVEGHTAAIVRRPAGDRGRSAYRNDKRAEPVDHEPDLLPPFDSFTRRKHFVDLFKTGAMPFNWTASGQTVRNTNSLSKSPIRNELASISRQASARQKRPNVPYVFNDLRGSV
jgi:hypothetical protein